MAYFNPLSKLAQQKSPFDQDYDCSHANCHNFVRSHFGKLYPNQKDFDTDKPICPKHSKTCDFCSETFDSDKVKILGTNQICDNCKSKVQLVQCPNCQQTIDKSDLLIPENKGRPMYGTRPGCNLCSAKCQTCGKIKDKEDIHTDPSGDQICEDCYSEYWATCDNCSAQVPNEDTHYVESGHGTDVLCDNCYNQTYSPCAECGEDLETEDKNTIKIEGQWSTKYYHRSCAKDVLQETHQLNPQFKFIQFHKRKKYLNKLFPLLPISAKELRIKYPSISDGLKDLISFSKGKTITSDLVNQYLQETQQKFDIEFSPWGSDQRSLTKHHNKPQLVLNIVANQEFLNELKHIIAGPQIFDIISHWIGDLGHPQPQNKQGLGWARLELDPNKEFILIDEIQSDHPSSCHDLLTNKKGNEQVRDQVKSKILENYAEVNLNLKISDNQTEELVDRIIRQYLDLFKDFPDIAMQAITQFAQKHGYKKLYYHTYEGGKKLKSNDPPRSMYTDVPKANLFEPSTQKPFGLEADFLEREAMKAVQEIQKVAQNFHKKQSILGGPGEYQNKKFSEDFSDYHLEHYTFKNCKFVNCNFNNADLIDVIFSDCQFKNCNLSIISFFATEFKNCDFGGAELTSFSGKGANRITGNIINANLSGVNFHGIDDIDLDSFINCDLSGADFSRNDLPNFEGCDLSGADFSHSLLDESKITNCNLEFADFTNAQLSKVNFHNSSLEGCNFSNAELAEMNFKGMNLSNCNFAFANLNAAVLTNAICVGCNFEHAELDHAQFNGAILQGAKFDRANMKGTNFDGADLKWSSLDPDKDLMEKESSWVGELLKLSRKFWIKKVARG